MAATAPYRPNTTESKLALPLNGSIFTTRREVNPRKPTVDIGGTMESELGTTWADSYVIGSGIIPEKSLEIQQFTHARIPTVAVQLNSNWEWTSVDLGGRRFEGVARTFVYLATAFDEETLIAGAAMEIGSDSRFSGDGYILVDRDTSRMGMELEPTFRVERRTYIQRTVMGVVTRDTQTGRSTRSTITLYYRGELISGTAIETLAAAPENAYWGQQANGTFRELEQLTTDWFSVTESSAIPANAENSLSNPAKTRITERITPLGTDLVFREIGTMPDPVPAYDSAHYDATGFPNYKLAHIEPEGPSGLLYTFHYAKARTGQDAYNWEHTQADIGGNKFAAVTREIVTLRSAFNPASPAMGSALADTPSSLFAGTYVLSARKQTRTNDPKIDNLFVIERITYVRKITLGELRHHTPTGRAIQDSKTLYFTGEDVNGSPIETLYADTDNAYWGLQADGEIREVRKISESWYEVSVSNSLPEAPINSNTNKAKARVVERVTPLDTDVMFFEIGAMPDPEPIYGSAHYDATAWPDHKLVLIQADDASGNLHKFTYVADRATQDEYNFSHTQANIGGSKYEVVKRDYVVLRSAFDPQSPASASAMPNTPTDLFATGYVLIDKEQRRIGKELDSLYVSETRTYAKRCTITQLGVDALNGKALTSIETLWHKDEVVTGGTTAAALFDAPNNTYWGMQADGTQRRGRQLSCNWYSITIEAVVGGAFVDGVIAVDSFTTNDNYFWPAVLSYASLYAWARRDGGQDTYPTVKFSPEAYRGPCLTTVTRTWSKTAFTIPKVSQMMPTRVSVSCPYYALNIPECLHAEIDLTISSGTTDPEYEYIIQTEFFPATNYEVWPATITAYDDQTPFRGGFLRTVRVVEKPE